MSVLAVAVDPSFPGMGGVRGSLWRRRHNIILIRLHVGHNFAVLEVYFCWWICISWRCRPSAVFEKWMKQEVNSWCLQPGYNSFSHIHLLIVDWSIAKGTCFCWSEHFPSSPTNFVTLVGWSLDSVIQFLPSCTCCKMSDDLYASLTLNCIVLQWS